MRRKEFRCLQRRGEGDEEVMSSEVSREDEKLIRGREEFRCLQRRGGEEKGAERSGR